MALCVNRTGLGYSTLKEMSGISGFMMDVMTSHYLEKYGRFPRLNELPHADSRKYLQDKLDGTITQSEDKENWDLLKVSKDALLEYTESTNIEEATSVLQKNHNDLQINVTEVGSTVHLEMRRVPTKYDNVKTKFEAKSNSVQLNAVLLNNVIENLLQYSGQNVIKITDAELATPEWRSILQGRSLVKAFVYQGQIYINVDRASIDDHLHELLHILLGSTAMQDPDLYMAILGALDQDIDYVEQQAINYPGRSRQDLLEELLVKEVAKHVVGLKSKIQDLDENIKVQLFENIARAFDRALEADNSSLTLDPNILLNSKLYDLSVYLGEATIKQQAIQQSWLHRQYANTIEKLIKDKKLREECNGSV